MKMLSASNAFVAALEKKILAHDNKEFSLLLAQWLARFLTSNFCGRYHFSHVEESLARRFTVDGLIRPTTTGDCLHVASEVYAYGGHTRLMRNLMSSAPKNNRQVLLTRPNRRRDAAAILDVDVEHVTICTVSSQEARVVQLAQQLLRFEKIVLHIHPDDVAIAVAVVLAKRVAPSLKVYFVNHSDHTFSVAVNHADVVFEISGYGWSLRAVRGIEDRSTFLGIPLRMEMHAHAPEAGSILTGGSSYKYRPNRSNGLPAMMAEILAKEPSARILAIGPKALDFWWWKLHLRFPKRFIRQTRIPHVEYVKKFRSCSVYVDSYPVTGGTAFTEALISGVSVVGLRGGPNGYGIADALRLDNVGDFIEHAGLLLRQDHDALATQARIRRRAEEVHAIEAVHTRFISVLQDAGHFEPPAELLTERYEFDFRTEWLARHRPFAAGFADPSEFTIIPTLLFDTTTCLKSGLFAIALLAKASVATLRHFVTTKVMS